MPPLVTILFLLISVASFMLLTIPDKKPNSFSFLKRDNISCSGNFMVSYFEGYESSGSRKVVWTFCNLRLASSFLILSGLIVIAVLTSEDFACAFLVSTLRPLPRPKSYIFKVERWLECPNNGELFPDSIGVIVFSRRSILDSSKGLNLSESLGVTIRVFGLNITFFKFCFLLFNFVD